jgi:hypothetical protein
MLRQDVIDAVERGEFHIYPIATIDEGIEVLTGVPAGTRGDDDLFPEGTINRRVEDRLIALAEKRRSFAARPRGDGDGDQGDDGPDDGDGEAARGNGGGDHGQE